MDNVEKYELVLSECFQISRSQLKGLKYQDIAAWDSVGHMALISAIEEDFDIMMETDDIIDFSSYEKGLFILEKKYNVQF
jgi:acyl carrier protein